MDTICLNIEFVNEELDKYGHHSALAIEQLHHAHLVIENLDCPELSLKVFFQEETGLSDKIGQWIVNNPQRNLFNLIKVNNIPTNDDLALLEVDFSQTQMLGAQGTLHEEDKSYYLLVLDKVRLVYDFNPSDFELSSQFYLNPAAFQMIKHSYAFYQFNWKTPEKWEAKHKREYLNFSSFDKAEFRFDFDFHTREGQLADEVVIKKEPLIRLKYSNLTEQQQMLAAMSVCCLASFYVNNDIEINFARVYTQDRRIVYVGKIKNENRTEQRGLFFHEFSQNPLQLIKNVNAETVLTNQPFIQNLIQKFNLSLKTSSESKFMLLYNVLEQIRNFFIKAGRIEVLSNGKPANPKKVKEDFTFVYGKDKTDELIREKLKELAALVESDEKEDFIHSISDKVGFIKLKTMSNQFASLFEYCGIKPEDFELDFKQIKRLRNDIYHGHPIGSDDVHLEHINSKLPRFVGILLLSLLGIDYAKFLKLSRGRN